MKVKLRIRKDGKALYEGIYDVSDAESFGKACADAWTELKGTETGESEQHRCAFRRIGRTAA